MNVNSSILNVGTKISKLRTFSQNQRFGHNTHWHRPDKGGRSSPRQREATYCRGAEVSFCCREPGGPAKDHVPRMLLASQVKDFRNDFDNGTLVLYASLPCVGGSPWGNVDGLTVEGHDRIKEQQKLYAKLFNSFGELVDEVYDERTLIGFELSKNCKYWRWPMVRKFLIERFMSVHHFDGCMLGVLGNNNQPRKKSWTIAGNFEELSKLDSYRCDDSHEHDQSRGKALINLLQTIPSS